MSILRKTTVQPVLTLEDRITETELFQANALHVFEQATSDLLVAATEYEAYAQQARDEEARLRFLADTSEESAVKARQQAQAIGSLLLTNA